MTIFPDGQPVPAYEGEPLAAALAAAGVEILGRSMKYHRPRGATCGTGHCSHCLVRLDGLPNVRSCRTPVAAGQRVDRQNVLGGAEHDILGATDWLFPKGLDHHEMFTGVPLVRPMVDKVVRRLSGSGLLPDAPTPWGPAEDREVEVLVVGAGSAGLAAAEAARAAGAEVLLVEASGEVGGRTLHGLHPAEAAARTAERYLAGGGELWTGVSAVQVDREPGRLLVVLDRETHLVRTWPRAVVFANGGYPSLGLFENNDLPGVVHAAWAAALVHRWGVLPGERALVCADDPEAEAVAELLVGAGGSVVDRLPAAAAFRPEGEPGDRLVGVRGGKTVRVAEFERDGRRHEVQCDLVVLSMPPAPAFELAVNAGAAVAYDPAVGGFAVRTDAEGRTEAPDVFACGSLTGLADPTTAGAAGAAAGRAAAGRVAERRGGAHAS